MKDPCENCVAWRVGTCHPKYTPCRERLEYEKKQEELKKAEALLIKLQTAPEAERTHPILLIERRRAFEPIEGEDGKVDLNEGYKYSVDAPIPEIADAIAKMALEMDKMAELGEGAGGGFIALITEFHRKLKEGGE